MGQAFGIIGLEVMGRNIALNIERNGFPIAVYNRTWAKTEHFLNELAKGKNPPQPPKDQSEQSDNGESGAPSPATSSKGFQIYIPLEQGEKNPSGGEAGKAAPKERKG